MAKQLWSFLLAALLLTAAGCSPAASTAAPAATPAYRKAPATAAPTPGFAQASLSTLENSCGLINSRDLAGLFPTHTETQLAKPQIARVDHPAFSTGGGAGAETSCLYYSFYLPGRLSGTVLQVNYWLDVPASPATARAWANAWASAAQGAQSLPGIGDGAFFKDGRLSLKKGNVYVTVAAFETRWNLSSSAADRQQQLAVEQQIAGDLLSRLQ